MLKYVAIIKLFLYDIFLIESPLQIDTAAASILRATLVNIISIYPIVHYIHLHINLDKF